jgi:hypothetical protein
MKKVKREEVDPRKLHNAILKIIRDSKKRK